MEKKTIYVVVRVDQWEESKALQTRIHIYSNQSSNKEKIIEYGKKIKKTYPSKRVAVMSREKAKELQKKYVELNYKNEIKALAELENKSKDILLRQTVYNTFGIK